MISLQCSRGALLVNKIRQARRPMPALFLARDPLI